MPPRLRYFSFRLPLIFDFSSDFYFLRYFLILMMMPLMFDVASPLIFAMPLFRFFFLYFRHAFAADAAMPMHAA